jgi:shikimate dehydrogenase
VLGHPIAHSLSPVLHRDAYRQLGLPWHYDAHDVTADQLAAFLDALGPEWVGLSLTMPLKEVVIELLDEVDPAAARLRSVNTVLLGEGSRRGCNTDVTGLVGLLAHAGAGDRDDLSGAVLGAGATARSAVAAMAESGVGDLVLAARRPEPADQLLTLAADLGMCGRVVRWPPNRADLAADVVVSTVPAQAGALVEPPDRPGLLVDVLYDPWPTPLAGAWRDAGGTAVGGLELLVRQAVEQVLLMAGRRPDADSMRAAGQRELDRRSGAAGIAQADQ